MPEGDTVHRWAARINSVLAGSQNISAAAPNPRSPLHHRVAEIVGHDFDRAEARGKHLLIHLSGGLVVHSHLGMNGRWFAGPRPAAGRPWLVLGSTRGFASQVGGKILRLTNRSRIGIDPGLNGLGPDPLRSEFDERDATARLIGAGQGREVGDALLDQRIVAGIGNAIRNEACFIARIDPWRKVDGLEEEEAERLVRANAQVMRVSLARGKRPRSIYRAAGRPCPRCGERIRSRGQGDANRIAYWCPRCQS